MAKWNGPRGFIAVLPGEVVEIPQDGGKSWLTLFYCLPKELAGKWEPALDLPRCPYEVLRTDKYDSIVCDDIVDSCPIILAKGPRSGHASRVNCPSRCP